MTRSSESERDAIDSDKGLALFLVRELKVPVLAPDLHRAKGLAEVTGERFDSCGRPISNQLALRLADLGHGNGRIDWLTDCEECSD